jgi:hypothetical protein
VLPIAGLSDAQSYWSAGGILIAFLLLTAFVSGAVGAGTGKVPFKVRLLALVLGQDGRVSTSKTQFALWTLGLAYAFLVIILHVGTFSSGTLHPEYLLLLGFPAGAAGAASLLTSSKVQAGTITKTKAAAPTTSPAGILGDIVSNDAGQTSLPDLQYFLFNLVALAAFFVAFSHDPSQLPQLPDALVGLTSASASAYLLGKSGASDAVAITTVVPGRCKVGDVLRIFGSNLLGPAFDQTKNAVTSVEIDGVLASVDWTRSSDEVLVVTVPAIDDPAYPAGTEIPAPVKVTTAGGLSGSLAGALDVDPAAPAT